MKVTGHDRLLIGFYGDDFTGSTDVMEVLEFAGLPTVLFLSPPTPEQLARFSGLAAIGIAGTARAQSPGWMDANLPQIFDTLSALDPELIHYKICSTFDSAPDTGSIGRALEIGLRQTGAAWASMLVAAPRLRRYQFFGNLFATVDGIGYRLDRHPTMARHPVTPMLEADLRLHLADQTDLPVGLVDVLQLAQGDAALTRALLAGARIVLLDGTDEASMISAGRLIWDNRGKSRLSVSSSGLQYALTAHWRATGELPEQAAPARVAPVDRLFVVSGSCSPGTAAQIDWAEAEGWLCLRADPADLLQHGVHDLAQSCLAALDQGRDVVVYTAKSPTDPAIAAFNKVAGSAGQAALGRALADLTKQVTASARLPRIVVVGGDTSGHITQGLGIYALTAVAPLAPGSPLCRAHALGAPFDGLTIALKGGQVGGPEFFGLVKTGVS